MLKCPFCGFDNEDGALFCDQCKSDLSGVESSTPVAVAEAIPMAVAEAVPMAVAEAVPMVSEAVEAMPVEAVPVFAEAVAVEAVAVEVVEAVPLTAEPVVEVAEAIPMFAAPVAEPAAPPPPPPAPQPAVVAPPPPPPPPPPVAAAPVAPAAPTGAIPAGATPIFVVIRGQKPNQEYPIYEGENYVGRSDEKPVDIDLEDQEPPDRVFSSRQHAVIFLENGIVSIEDLNSSNGTFLNRQRVYPGQKRQLNLNDVVQIGTVQLKLKV
jgi:hypothetical protein